MDNLSDIFNPINVFRNKSIAEIGKITGLNISLKSKKISTSSLTNSMLSYLNINPKTLQKAESCLIKTVTLKENGISKEAMSFEQVRFHDVIKERWENSFLKEKFTKITFIFLVFQRVGTGIYFKGFKCWKMPDEMINLELRAFWSKLKNILEEGVTLTFTKRGDKTITLNNFPSSKDSKIMHIRPKASNALDTTELPDGQLITKQAYWINASYISEVLSDLPKLNPIYTYSSSETKQLTFVYEQMKENLTNEIYTIEEFVKIFCEKVPNFNQFDVSATSLEHIGFNLIPPFILSEKYNSLDDYFDKQILASKYFISPKDNEVWRSAYSQRKLKNMENNYSIFKIEEQLYLTKTALENANINLSTVISYREAVENFVSLNQYFTLNSLKGSGFYHPIENFGFDQLFYVSLLKRPGYLKHLSICGNDIFIKSPFTPKTSEFIMDVFKRTRQRIINLDSFNEFLLQTYNLNVTLEDLNVLLKSVESNSFYSESLGMLFATKEDYLNFIH